MTRVPSAIICLVVCTFLGAGSSGAATPDARATYAAQQQAQADYDSAKTNTADGSRAYSWWRGGINLTPYAGEPLVSRLSIFLLVRTDGSGTLIGASGQRIALGAEEIAPFEAAVRRAGFPRFRSLRTPSYRVSRICNDALPPHFEAAIRGKIAGVFGSECGQFALRLDVAVRMLLRIADAHGALR